MLFAGDRTETCHVPRAQVASSCAAQNLGFNTRKDEGLPKLDEDCTVLKILGSFPKVRVAFCGLYWRSPYFWKLLPMLPVANVLFESA